MGDMSINDLDIKIRDAFSIWNKVDELDVKILEGLSLFGPRNIALIAKQLEVPITTMRYRVQRMLSESVLFFHLNPYHTYMGLKKAVVFIEAVPGCEDILLRCLRANDFWVFLCRIYGPYEGCEVTWTIPKEKTQEFEAFLQSLRDYGVARSIEVNYSTCFEGVPVQSRWFDIESAAWVFDWDEWIKEVETIEGELPYTLVEPSDWPIKVDHDDLLIIKELEIDGRRSLTEISKKLDVPLERLKYHFKEHVSKRGLIEGYQVEIYRFPSPISENLFFKFEFDSYEKMVKFALTLHDKPFPFYLGKVLGENAIITQVYLPRREFRNFIAALSSLIKRGALKSYHYVITDIFQVWRETIPYQHFEDGKWHYDGKKHQEKLRKILEEGMFFKN